MTVECLEFGGTCFLCKPEDRKCKKAIEDGANMLIAGANIPELNEYFATSIAELGLPHDYTPQLILKAAKRAREIIVNG